MVGPENAAEYYSAAHHPKSFISLDGPKHLLMRKDDSSYEGEFITSLSFTSTLMLMNLRNTLPAPTKPANIPNESQWLSREGAGSWFFI